MPFDVLIETSQSMFDFYKNKLEEEDAKIQREEEKDHQGGLQVICLSCRTEHCSAFLLKW